MKVFTNSEDLLQVVVCCCTFDNNSQIYQLFPITMSSLPSRNHLSL